MPPNVIVSDKNESIEYLIQAKKTRNEIYYDGFFYDVTDFIDRHPGGEVIKFYTEKGEDATQAIQQFHFRSKAKVESIMKSLKKRPAQLHERGLDFKALSRHEALSTDFKKLFQELQAEGYFEPSIRQVILRILECCALILIGYGVLFQSEMKFVGTMLVGFGMSRFGWLQHEGGHRSLTGHPKIDQFIQDIGSCVFLGTSSMWWNNSHVKHHAMPQRIQHDVDIDTLPFVAFHKKLVKEKTDFNSFFIRHQYLFFGTLDMLLLGIALKFYINPRFQWENKLYYEMLLNLPTFVPLFFIHPMYYFLTAYWLAFFMGTNLFLNHTHLEVTDKPTHWIEYSFTHTANITPSIFVDFWMAYLNYQIEHHLFPTMPQFRHKEISHRVKALAEKHGLPYRVLSYPEAWKVSFGNLSKVGKELTEG